MLLCGLFSATTTNQTVSATISLAYTLTASPATFVSHHLLRCIIQNILPLCLIMMMQAVYIPLEHLWLQQAYLSLWRMTSVLWCIQPSSVESTRLARLLKTILFPKCKQVLTWMQPVLLWAFQIAAWSSLSTVTKRRYICAHSLVSVGEDNEHRAHDKTTRWNEAERNSSCKLRNCDNNRDHNCS